MTGFCQVLTMKNVPGPRRMSIPVMYTLVYTTEVARVYGRPDIFGFYQIFHRTPGGLHDT
jgi:hypothetical protein